MKKLIALCLLSLVPACTESRVVTDGGVLSDAVVPSDTFDPRCGNIYAQMDAAADRLGIVRETPWPCPSWIETVDDISACVLFLQTAASSEAEIESCEVVP